MKKSSQKQAVDNYLVSQAHKLKTSYFLSWYGSINFEANLAHLVVRKKNVNFSRTDQQCFISMLFLPSAAYFYKSQVYQV